MEAMQSEQGNGGGTGLLAHPASALEHSGGLGGGSAPRAKSWASCEVTPAHAVGGGSRDAAGGRVRPHNHGVGGTCSGVMEGAEPSGPQHAPATSMRTLSPGPYATALAPDSEEADKRLEEVGAAGPSAAGTPVQRWGQARAKARVHAAASTAAVSAERAKVLGTAQVLTGSQLAALATRPDSHDSMARVVCIFLPGSSVRTGWDGVVVALLMWTAFMVPLRIAFSTEEDQGEEGTIFYIEMGVDILFLADVIINFFSAYYVGTKLVTSHKRIAAHYVRGWFVFDVLGSVPLSMLNGGPGLYLRQLKLLKLPRLFKLLKLLRLFKMVKVLRMRVYLKNLDKLLHINPGALRMAKFCFWFIIFAHWCACFWYFCSAFNDNEPYTWVARHGHLQASDSELYLVSMYWALATLTTMVSAQCAALDSKVVPRWGRAIPGPRTDKLPRNGLCS